MATLKQKRVAKNLLENRGKSVSQAMVEEGYSEATAKNPKHLTESKGWKELMDQYIPEEKLMNKLEEGLDAFKLHTSMSEPDIPVPDYAIRHKYLETSFKLRKRIGSETVEDNKASVNITIFNANVTAQLQPERKAVSVGSSEESEDVQKLVDSSESGQNSAVYQSVDIASELSTE